MPRNGPQALWQGINLLSSSRSFSQGISHLIETRLFSGAASSFKGGEPLEKSSGIAQKVVVPQNVSTITGFSNPRSTFQETIARLLVQNILTYEVTKSLEEKSKKLTEERVEIPAEKDFAGKAVRVVDQKIAPINHEKRGGVVATSGLGGLFSSKKICEFHKLVSELFPADSADVVEIFVPSSEVFQVKRDEKTKEKHPISWNRYLNGMAQYYDRDAKFYSEISMEFLQEVFMPRFCDKDGKLKEPQDCPRILVVNHSIAAREAGSHLICLKNFLHERGVKEEDIKKYTDKVLRLNIASPLVENYYGLSRSVDILNLDDCGSVKPSETLSSVYLNPDCHEKKIFKARSGEQNFLMVIGFGVLGDDPKDTHYHAFSSHVKTIIKEANEFSDIIGLCRKFADKTVSDEAAIGAFDSFVKEQKVLRVEDLSPEKFNEVLENLLKCWTQRHLQQAGMFPAVRKSQQPLPIIAPTATSKAVAVVPNCLNSSIA